MNETNFIGFKEGELKKPIFRVFSCCRFVETLANRRLTLVKPKLWDDPFENFILQSRFRLREGTIIKLAASEQLYGQCWSRTKESDAMWRIYAPDKDGVKVRTTLTKLGNALWASCVSQPEISCFVGQVRYLSRLKLSGNLSALLNVDNALSDTSGREHARSLLLKRQAFNHENEVRLIYYNRHESYDEDVIHFPINPVDVFDQVIFDPRIAVREYEEKRAMVVKLGYPLERIKRSGLYEPPDLIFEVGQGSTI
jgi:hypothetical protein